jgi:hypothetical protein
VKECIIKAKESFKISSLYAKAVDNHVEEMVKDVASP